MSGPYTILKTTLSRKAPDVYNKETKKMNFLTRWFDRKCKEAWERAQNEPCSPSRLIPVEEPSLICEGMSIRLFGATGGTIVEFRRYDTHKDRTNNKMYVIPTEQNFNEQFTKIVSMEMLR
jgi:hypothetical protein